MTSRCRRRSSWPAVCLSPELFDAIKRFALAALFATSFLASDSAWSAPQKASIEELSALPIICLVPQWLPKGYRLRSATIDRDDREGVEDAKAPGYPAYQLQYTNGAKGEFTVECARWGIGDRNLDTDDNAEESAFQTPSFGNVYIIYLPKGKSGVKKRIVANWIADTHWKAEEKKQPSTIHQLGRVHGVSGFGMTLEEFEKIVQSLRPVREQSAIKAK